MKKIVLNRMLNSAIVIVGLTMLSVQAQALQPLPPVPQANKPTPPYHIVAVPMHGPGAITPAQIRKAYGFPANYQGAGQTIAIIDSGDDPNIEADLNTFSTQFNLPACTTANGCFKKMYSAGTKPAADAGWAVETSLDVEWAHAVAPLAKILLIESEDAYSLYDAVNFAIQQHPSVISLSWGSGEFSSETYFDSMFQSSPVPILAATGDSGYGVWYPAASPYVVAVGGTQITMDSSGNLTSEIAWAGSGGGISTYEAQPAYQKNYVIPQSENKRGVPDVVWNGSGNSPYSVYDSFNMGGWLNVAGTSASTPQWAALIAVMKSAKNGNFGSFNTSIYSVARSNPPLLNDITTGTNGSCGYVCQTRSGYDYVSGLGSPQAAMLINRFK